MFGIQAPTVIMTEGSYVVFDYYLEAARLKGHTRHHPLPQPHSASSFEVDRGSLTFSQFQSENKVLVFLLHNYIL